jgi:hypothetical protein
MEFVPDRFVVLREGREGVGYGNLSTQRITKPVQLQNVLQCDVTGDQQGSMGGKLLDLGT